MPAEPWDPKKIKATVEDEQIAVIMFVVIFSISGLAFIIYFLKLMSLGELSWIQGTKGIAISILVIFFIFHLFRNDPTDEALEELIARNGWWSKPDEWFNHMLAKSVILFLVITLILAWDMILIPFDHELAPETGYSFLLFLFPIPLLLFAFWLTSTFLDSSISNLEVRKYFTLDLKEGRTLLDEARNVLIEFGEVTSTTHSFKLSDEFTTIKLFRLNVLEPKMLLLTLSTKKTTEEQNIRLRNTIDAILEGRPLPQAADRAATDDKAAEEAPEGEAEGTAPLTTEASEVASSTIEADMAVRETEAAEASVEDQDSAEEAPESLIGSG